MGPGSVPVVIRLLLAGLIRLLSNAVGLLVAVLVLDQLSMDAASFVVAVAIFTVVEVLVEPLLREVSARSLPALRGSVSLIATFVGLVVTKIFSSGMHISGLSTWVLATLVVWLAALLASLVLPLVIVRRAVEDHREQRR